MGSKYADSQFCSVFKIIEEFSAGAEEQMASLEERLEATEKENQELQLRLRNL